MPSEKDIVEEARELFKDASPRPWLVEIHDARGDYAKIALVTRNGYFETGYYVITDDDMACRREQALADFKAIARAPELLRALADEVERLRKQIMRATDRPQCFKCTGFLNRVGKTPNGIQKYRCSNCGAYDSDAKQRTIKSKQDRERQRIEKTAENAATIQRLRDMGFVTRGEMAQRLGISLTWLAQLSKLGRLEEVRQRGRFGRYWVRELSDTDKTERG